GDQLMVRDPGESIQKAVRIVIGKENDQLTFEGDPVKLADLRAALEKVADRPDTLLEIAIASDDVTVAQTTAVLAIAQNMGFKAISQVGKVRPLGSKASDGAATQPSSDAEKEKARDIWNRALDAEHDQDFSKAISYYKELKQLDPAVRQSDKVIDMRLSYT